MNEETLFAEALARQGEARAAFLDEHCRDDLDLRRRLEGLLHASDHPDPFLEAAPVVGATIDHRTGEQPGKMIGPYKLLEQIGEGGFGVVYLAEQTEPVRRQVALKILKPGMDTRQIVARFEAERQALAIMDHPNIAKVFDGGSTEVATSPRDANVAASLRDAISGRGATGLPYFVMELVKGIPITEYCDQNHLTPRQRLELFIPVCQAVQHAHQKGIIHRDLKPSNVLVTRHDSVAVPKVIDFGVAKALGHELTDKTLHTGIAQMIGTPLYMSPEQAGMSDLDVDTRSDIYSLGVLLYELLTGTTPFEKERFKQAAYDEIRRIIREEEPPKPSTRISTLARSATTLSMQRKSDPKRLSQLLRGELDWIVMKCLEKDRNRRYESACALSQDVEHYLCDRPVQACPPSASYRLRKFARRNKTGLAIAGLVLLFVTLLGATAGWFLHDRATRQALVVQQTQESLSRARGLIAERKVALAREELAEAKGRLGEDYYRLPRLARELETVDDEIRTVDAALNRFQQFLALIDRAHDAEFPQAAAITSATGVGGVATPLQRDFLSRNPANAVPLLLQALACYGILKQDDWISELEGGLLTQDQVLRVRRAAYEELLWLANDAVRRGVDHESGMKVEVQKAAEEGLAYLRQAETALNPTSAFYQIRAACHKNLGRRVGQDKDLELARQAPGTIALDFYLPALAAFDARQKAEAIRNCEAALCAEPTHYWSLLLLGDCFLVLGETDQDLMEAKTAFTGCILKRPDHALVYLKRGYTYYMLQRNHEAMADSREALRLRPEYAEAHNNLGMTLADLGKLAEAETEYREAVRLKPGLPQAHCNIGIILNQRGKHREAEAEIREALRLKPDDPQAFKFYFHLGNALADQEKLADAVAEYRKALRLKSDDAAAHNNLGNVLYQQDKYPEAEAEFRVTLRLQPDSPEAHNNLGNSLGKQGKHSDAESEYREALRLKPDFPEAHHGLGIALASQGKLSEAEVEYREALRLKPDFPEAQDNLINLLFRQTKYRQAEAEIREILRLKPNSPATYQFYFQLGIALANQGKLPEAETEYRKALRLKPDFAEAHCNLGALLQRQGRFAESLNAYRRGHELGTSRPNWDYPSADWVRQAERLVALNAKLSSVLKGESQPADASERIGLAEFCQKHKKLYAAATRFYAEALAAEPKFADDLVAQLRYNAACAAALAGCGQGADGPSLNERERARLRRQSLDWLRSDLATWETVLKKDSNTSRAEVERILRHWQQDADFAGVRGDASAKLPEPERQPWQGFWRDVERTLMKATAKGSKSTK